MSGIVHDSRGHVHIDRTATDFHELFVVMKGILNIEGNGIRSSAGPGTVLLHPRGCRQTGTQPSPDDLSYVWIHFRSALVEVDEGDPAVDLVRKALLTPRDRHGGSGENLTRVVVPHEFIPPRISFVADLAWEIAGNRPHLTVEKSALTTALLGRLSAEFLTAGAALPAPVAARGPAVARNVQALIDKRIDNRQQVHRLTVRQIAGEMRFNPDYLNRLFKSATGRPLSEHILMTKLHYACRLLGTGMDVKETAWASGFANAKHFATIFKARTGATPSDYRARQRLVG